MCDCLVCQYSKKVKANLEGLPLEKRQFFEDMYDILLNIEMDRDCYKAILDGTWPNADEVLKSYRNKNDSTNHANQSITG